MVVVLYCVKGGNFLLNPVSYLSTELNDYLGDLGSFQEIFSLVSISVAMITIKFKQTGAQKSSEVTIKYELLFRKCRFGYPRPQDGFFCSFYQICWNIETYSIILLLPFCVLWLTILIDINKFGLLTFPNLVFISFTGTLIPIYMYQIYAFGFRYFGVFGFSFLIIFIALLLVGNVFALRDLDEFTFVESKYFGL